MIVHVDHLMNERSSCRCSNFIIRDLLLLYVYQKHEVDIIYAWLLHTVKIDSEPEDM